MKFITATLQGSILRGDNTKMTAAQEKSTEVSRMTLAVVFCLALGVYLAGYGLLRWKHVLVRHDQVAFVAISSSPEAAGRFVHTVSILPGNHPEETLRGLLCTPSEMACAPLIWLESKIRERIYNSDERLTERAGGD